LGNNIQDLASAKHVELHLEVVSPATDEFMRTSMARGTVKWFNPAKGYGFIIPEDGNKDVFVHISAVQRAGLASLTEGQRIEYELTTGHNGKTSATNLVLTP
jgi:CspA family cold shock protein